MARLQQKKQIEVACKINRCEQRSRQLSSFMMTVALRTRTI
jgi:hypothetical protein